MNISKHIKKGILSLITICLFTLGLGFTNVKANDNSNYYDLTNVSESLEEIDPYIVAQDNRFILTLPDNVTLSVELQQKIETQLDTVNKVIADSNYVIDKNTKIAHPENEISLRKYGKNAIYIHWNYFEIWMDGGLVNTLVKAGVAGAVVAIAAAFPPLVAWIAANPVSGVVLVAVVASILDSLIGYSVNDGVIVHYNFLMFQVTHIEMQ